MFLVVLCKTCVWLQVIRLCVSYVSEVCKGLINTYGPGFLPWHPKIPINSSSIPNWLMARYHQSSTFIPSGFRSSSSRKVLFRNQTCYFKQSLNVWPSFALADAVTTIGCTLHKLTFDKFGYFVFQRPEGKQVHPLSEGSHLAMFQSLVAEFNDERRWNTATELDTHAQGKLLEKRFRWCYVNCEDHESERKRMILIFEMNGNSMASTEP